jgi:hypothetical protein
MTYAEFLAILNRTVGNLERGDVRAYRDLGYAPGSTLSDSHLSRRPRRSRARPDPWDVGAEGAWPPTVPCEPKEMLYCRNPAEGLKR